MRLRRIELTNYCQHRKLDVDFSGSLIAIFGGNGQGKSNLIGAIMFALIGEQTGFTRDDLTTWGEEEGVVRLFFDAGSGDERFVITRKTNGSVILNVGGDEDIKQASNVEAVLHERAGLDKELIRQMAFAPQNGIDAILFGDPKTREVAFLRLIGIGNASKIYTALGTEITALDKLQGFDDAIARSRQQLEEQESMAKVSCETLGKYEDVLKGLPAKNQLEAEVDKLVGAQGASEEVRGRFASMLVEPYNLILRGIAEERRKLESARESIKKTQKLIDELVAKKELADKTKEKVDTLKRVREWFHFREGPRIMARNVLRDLTTCVNDFLDQFGAPFLVDAAEEGFGFRFRFVDGRATPCPHPDASLLSGGQRVVLAIAFRLAIYMRFGSELGLLSLDEPTLCLDNLNVQRLGGLLTRVGEIARKQRLQIIMATHEKALMPFFDTNIDLGAMTRKED